MAAGRLSIAKKHRRCESSTTRCELWTYGGSICNRPLQLADCQLNVGTCLRHVLFGRQAIANHPKAPEVQASTTRCELWTYGGSIFNRPLQLADYQLNVGTCLRHVLFVRRTIINRQKAPEVRVLNNPLRAMDVWRVDLQSTVTTRRLSTKCRDVPLARIVWTSGDYRQIIHAAAQRRTLEPSSLHSAMSGQNKKAALSAAFAAERQGVFLRYATKALRDYEPSGFESNSIKCKKTAITT